jgi:glyoxylase I family protein
LDTDSTFIAEANISLHQTPKTSRLLASGELSVMFEKSISEEKMKYQIEHIGFAVEAPAEMAKWYQDILGFNIKLNIGNDKEGVAFIEESNGHTTLEIFNILETIPLRKNLNHHLQFHIAFECDDPDTAAKDLVKHGASFIEKCPRRMEGDYLVVLNDPWGNCIQFVRRKEGRFNLA